MGRYVDTVIESDLSITDKVHMLERAACRYGNGYMYVSGVALSHLIWNLYHPEDPVKKGEHIHHKNGIPTDNRIENFSKKSRADHNRHHYQENSQKNGGVNPLHSKESRTKARVKMMGHEVSEETRQKIREAHLGKILTTEHKQKLREAKLGKKQKEEHIKKRSESIRKVKSAKMKWDPGEALFLRDDGVSKREIARRLGVDRVPIANYFKIRGIAW